jgi:hypothetical protein
MVQSVESNFTPTGTGWLLQQPHPAVSSTKMQRNRNSIVSRLWRLVCRIGLLCCALITMVLCKVLCSTQSITLATAVHHVFCSLRIERRGIILAIPYRCWAEEDFFSIYHDQPVLEYDEPSFEFGHPPAAFLFDTTKTPFSIYPLGCYKVHTDLCCTLNRDSSTTEVAGPALVGTPIWPPLALFTTAPRLSGILSFRSWRRTLHRKRSHLCLVCGYDLRGSSTRCPECGSQIASGAAFPNHL